MAFKFPRSKRNNDGTYGPTSRNHYYFPVSYHARTSLKRSSKSRWCLREAEQFCVFRIADEPWWECVLNHCLFSIVDFGNIILGENGERLAAFPIPRNPNDYWHGYPIRTEESKPGPNLPDRWEEEGIITPHLWRKIETGRL